MILPHDMTERIEDAFEEQYPKKTWTFFGTFGFAATRAVAAFRVLASI
jgi:hypothetical protein